jgi:metal-responsive CopG/Arc/MetJ family transcriptional regulator
MRTTVTLEEDVAARLKRLRKDRPFKDLVNDALRAGLDTMESKHSSKQRRYVITPVKGHPLRTNLDNIAEVLAQVEGDSFR